MNLDTLPIGTHMYTAMLSSDQPGPEACYDEVDFTASSRLSAFELLVLAGAEAAADYGSTPVVGLVDQSTGGWVWRAEGWR